MSKNILIAGGTDGIGLAFLKRCIKSRTYRKIYVIGRNVAPIKRLKDRRIVPIVCDITDTEALRLAIRQINVPLDVFVNTVGSFMKKPARDLTPEEIRRHFELNSIANITLTTLVLPKLKRPFSQILVCLATLAVEARENYSLQAATKASYRFYLNALRKEIGRHSRVMMIHPSSVQTNIFQKSGDKRDVSKYPSAGMFAELMEFMLSRPTIIELQEVAVYNR